MNSIIELIITIAVVFVILFFADLYFKNINNQKEQEYIEYCIRTGKSQEACKWEFYFRTR